MRMSVLQSWLEEIPIRMQATLILGLRGPDTHACPGVKKIGRWLRALTFKPGNPANVREFMLEGLPDRIIEKSSTAKELEFCSQHYYSHLLHALEVVAFRHPERHIAIHAYFLMIDMCNLMHLPTESRENFEDRLQYIEWPGGQPETIAEALGTI